MAGAKRPCRLQVGALTYEVTWDEATITKACRSEESDLLGHCDGRHLRIAICPDAAPDGQRETLLHEALHAVLGSTGLGTGLRWDEDEEETIVRTLSPLLLDLLRRNPKLVRFLLEGA